MSDQVELNMAFSLNVNVALPAKGHQKQETIARKATALELERIIWDMDFLALQLGGKIIEHRVQNGERRFRLSIPAEQEEAVRRYLLDNHETEILLPKRNDNKKVTWPNFIRFVPKL